MQKIHAMTIAQKILALLWTHHRSEQIFTAKECMQETLHYEKIFAHVLVEKPLVFILPAFPAKSANQYKTAGPLPDLGERLALAFLNNICLQIGEFYSPGASIIICSDGRVFNDLVNVENTAVDAYAAEIRRILIADSLTRLDTLDLETYYPKLSYASMREKLVQEFGESIAAIQAKIKADESERLLFCGIHRFIYEDYLTQVAHRSKNQLRQLTKTIAYQVIQRSNAWSNLLKNNFPDAVRLSIHPQQLHSEKLGIMLLKSRDRWATPWHRVVLYDGKEAILIRKKDAETLNATPIFIQNQFSHYAMEGGHIEQF